MLRTTFLVLAILLLSSTCGAQESAASRPADVYSSVALSELETLDGTWPDVIRDRWLSNESSAPPPPVFFPPPIEGFLTLRDGAIRLVARSPVEAEVTALFMLPRPEGGSTRLRVRVPPGKVAQGTRKEFLEAARDHYAQLVFFRPPGTAWFRHRLDAIEVELGIKKEPASGRPGRSIVVSRRDGSDEIEETYDFFSAGRAVSENLRLDRLLAPIDGGEPTIPIETLKGIETKAFDWTAATAKLSPKKDPLAALIPEDQHAAFFPNLTALSNSLDALDRQAAPLMLAATERSEEAGLRAFYESQLAFPVWELAQDSAVGPVVTSVAVTGSDPYFATGTDVAILLECAEPEALKQRLSSRHDSLLRPGVTAHISAGSKVKVASVSSRDRTISSYVSVVNDVVVVVTNSLDQLGRIVKVAQRRSSALAASPEYVFFRDRYPRGDASETAFILLTDATIRRWCGPRWRIADARRTRAAAQLAQLTAENSGAIVRGSMKPGPFTGTDKPPGLDPLSWVPEGIQSGTWGNLRFLTPILELDVSKVTPAEAAAYEQFRSTYELRWAQFFDPIAVRLELAPSRIGVDATVMPLVASSEYRDLMDLARAVRFGPTACDPHDKSLVQLTLAVDATAAALEPWEHGARRLTTNLEAVALAWLKGGISLAIEQDPVLENLDPEHPEERLLASIPNLPVVLTAEVKDPVALALFLTGVRAKIEDTALGAVTWTRGKHRDVETMTLGGLEGFMGGPPSIKVRYTIVDGLLIVTLREDLLHRAIDRALDRRAGKATGPPWLGESVALRVDRRLVDWVAASEQRWFEQSQRELAWRALPILSEWHRLWPDQDPVAVHEKLFKVRLVDPAGGKYVVDRDGLRIVSETYGHPTETRPGPKRPAFLEGFQEARGGLTFENDGVRARFVIDREREKK